jgi:radical SAM superfamily enzyme YgiQ (UPF0313 family)
MKVLFLAKGQESLSIEYLSAVLKRAGHEVKLLFDPGLDDLLGFLDFKFLKLRNEEWYIHQIRTFEPTLICFSALTNLYSFVKEKAALIKKHLTIPIAVGGIHPTILPEYVLKNPDIDMICIGEGDEAIVELADRMEKGVDYFSVRNFWFKKDGKIVKNPIRPLLEDLDSLPFPDREIFYQYGCFAGTLYVITGRGCPFTCSYCCHHFLQKMYRQKGKYVRRRSIENVILELEECIRKFKVKTVYSMDDTFTLDEDWIEDFCREYQQRINLPLYCHIRPGTVSQRMIDNLKRANCSSVFFGTDSGNEEMRFKLMNRRIKDKAIIEDAELLKKNGFKITTSAMFCLPHETEQQMIDTVNLIRNMKSDYAYTYIYYPFPQTDSFQYCVENDLMNNTTVEKIYEGEGSFHKASLIKSDHHEIAQILKNILPFNIKFPKLNFLADFIIKKKLVTLSKLIFMITVPLTYAEYGRNKMREIISIAKVSMQQSRR